MGTIIVRQVKDYPRRTPREAINSTGRRRQHLNPEVVKEMSQGDGKKKELHFFHLGRYVMDVDDLAKEYDSRKLDPANPFDLIDVNEADSGFSDEHPNIIFWKNAAGKWCYIAFKLNSDRERIVIVGDDGYDVDAIWWYAGVKKTSNNATGRLEI